MCKANASIWCSGHDRSLLMDLEEQRLWDAFYAGIVGWSYHPGYNRDNIEKPTLEDCAKVADEMIEIRRKRKCFYSEQPD